MDEYDAMIAFIKKQESKGIDHSIDSLEKERKEKNVTQTKKGIIMMARPCITEKRKQIAEELGINPPGYFVDAPESPSIIRDENENVAAEVAGLGIVGKNESKALKRLLDALARYPGSIYCLFYKENDGDYESYLSLDHIKSSSGPRNALLFSAVWSELISLPWGSPGAAGSKCLWLVFELLYCTVEPGTTKFQEKYRAQLTAEFGGDPLEWKTNSE